MNDIASTQASAMNNNRSIPSSSGRTRSTLRRPAASAICLAGVALLGSSCSGGSFSESTSHAEFDSVQEVVVSEQLNDDGSSETLTVTVGEPASLLLTPVPHDITLVSPSEFYPGERCEGFGSPTPTAEVGRGVGEQNSAQFVWFVTDYADEESAWSAMTATSFCYDDYVVDLAADLGRTPGVSSLEQVQWAELVDGEPVQFSIDVPSFDEAGPAILFARTGGRVAVLLDLDNALGERDAGSMTADLLLGAEPGRSVWAQVV
jgi:hypothetical protein